MLSCKGKALMQLVSIQLLHVNAQSCHKVNIKVKPIEGLCIGAYLAQQKG
jgi:hypothetical protein